MPAPIRVERLLILGLGQSRAAVRRMVGDGRIRLPLALDAKAHQDFELAIDRAGPDNLPQALEVPYRASWPALT